MIYKELLVLDTPVMFHAYDQPGQMTRKARNVNEEFRGRLGIIFVNWQLYREATAVFFCSNNFKVSRQPSSKDGEPREYENLIPRRSKLTHKWTIFDTEVERQVVIKGRVCEKYGNSDDPKRPETWDIVDLR